MHDYRSASVSRIVAELGIAKGSVYQYFEGKQDLYFYLLDTASTKKLDFIQEHAAVSPESGSFFDVHRTVILGGAAFDFQHPRYSLLILNAMRERQSAELGDLAAELTRRSSEFLRDFVLTGVKKKEIRSDVDILLIVSIVNAMTLAMGPYMEQKYGFSLTEQLEHPERPLPFSQEELQKGVDALLEILRRGIAPTVV